MIADRVAEALVPADATCRACPSSKVASLVALRTGGIDGLPSIPLPASLPATPRSIASGSRQVVLEGLRSRIRALEQRAGKVSRLVAPGPDTIAASKEMEGQGTAVSLAAVPPQPSISCRPARPLAWQLGDASLDSQLPAHGLAPAALHEVKPTTALDWPAALAFSLQLASRRLAALPQRADAIPLVLWCTGTAFTAEHGRLHAPGLAAFGLDCRSILVVETARETDRLWAIEEGLRSSAPALVIGTLRGVGLTPARRLALATATSGVPCLILTEPRSQAAAATETRWRISRARSAPHPFDASAPGASRLRIDLERCRGSPPPSASQSPVVEWCDVTHRFRLVSGLADRPAETGLARSRAGATPLRAG